MKEHCWTLPILVVLLMSASTAQAQTVFHVRQGASGNGSDWTNAYSSLPSTLVRGATYFIADGSYPGYTFDDAESGTLRITIKKATVGDHGTNVGWSNAFGDGQAVFNGTLYFARDYYEINGVTRNEANWQDSASYGLMIRSSGNLIDANTTNLSGTADHVTIKYVDMGGTGICGGSDPEAGLYLVFNSRTGWYVGYSHIHNLEIPILSHNINDIIVEKNHIGPSWAKEAISNQTGQGWIIRYNKFIDNLIYPPAACQHGGDGGTADIWTRSGSNNNWEIYGNVFGDTGTYSNIVRNDAIIEGDCYNGGAVSGWKIYNNVFYNIGGNQARLNICGSNNVVYNNLWYKLRAATSGGAAARLGVNASVHDSAWCFEDTTLSITSGCTGLSATNLVRGTENPFVDVTRLDFRLKSTFSGLSPVNRGRMLGTGFNSLDPLGVIRGADGGWDIGAFEAGGLPVISPAPPTNLRIMR